MKLLLDTNALLDYYTQRQPFFEDMKKLRIAQYFGDVDFWACTQSFADIEYILRGAMPLPDLRKMMRSSLSFISIVPPAADALAKALESDWPDLEDYLIANCAEAIKASYIITRDTKGFQSSHVPAMPAREWLGQQSRQGITYEDMPL